jgi:polysaccharide biosynthesis transport protein
MTADPRRDNPAPYARYATADNDSLVPLRRHLIDYLRVIAKRRWTALPIFLLVMGAVTVSTFTATPIYEARTQLLIEVDNPNVVTFQEVLEQERATADYYETQYTILRSRSLARKAMDSLQLWDDPEFAGGQKTGFSPTGLLDDAKELVVNGIAKVLSPPAQPAPSHASQRVGGETVEQSRAIDRFLMRLWVEPVRNSRLVDVKFRSASPETAMAAANALAKAYVELLQDFRFQASKEASDWLTQRLAEQGQHVEAAELGLQRYREQNDVGATLEGRSNIVAQKLADLSAALTRANTERIGKETLYNQLRAIQKQRLPLDTFPAILSNSYITQLKSELTALQRQEAQLGERLADRHPEMIKIRTAIESAQQKLDAESAKVVRAVENDYRASVSQENTLRAAVETQRRELLAQDRRSIKMEALERDATTDRQIFESLLQRAKETGISGELKTSNIRIVDSADRPLAPIEPRKTRNLAFGGLVGSALALIFAFFFEYLDKSIRSPEEMKALGLPFLTLVPAVPGSSRSDGAAALSTTATHFAESLKSLRTKLLVSSPDNEPRSILITSTRPSEGKTVIATQLGISLAQTSRQVLIIDADMRQPTLHQKLDVPRAPGLSEVLSGKTTLKEALRQTHVDGLWALPAGERPENAAELLASKAFAALLKTIDDRFEWTIIDSAPVMAVTDPCIISPLVGGVLFVVGSEMTSRDSVQTAIEELEAVNTRFIGTILNRVKVYRNAFFYSDYYKPEYSRYYGVTRGLSGLRLRS